jgi:3-oxoacyl-[acyl-carrier-protein] synthase-3
MSRILDFAIRYPAGRFDVHAVHAASGVPEADILAITHCDGFPVLAEDETAWGLALTAARDLLERTGVPPDAVTTVVHAGTGAWDVPFWSPAAKIAHELGIGGAHCYEIANFCNAGTTALRLVGDRLDQEGGHALVLVADRLSRLVDHHDPVSKALFNFGDAAAAVLMTADTGPFLLRGGTARTDPSWCDYYYGEQRGERELVIRRGPHRPGLAQAYVDHFTALVAETLKSLGAGIDDVAWFLVNHGDKDMHERLIGELALPADRTVRNYDRLAHQGGADTLIALDLLRERRLLRPGDLILLATSAMGFSWGVTALEYQP